MTKSGAARGGCQDEAECRNPELSGFDSRKRPFAELPQILEAFRHVYYIRHDIAEVEVGTVRELSAAQDKKLRANLEKMLSRKVVVKYEIKPELLGGLVIKFNSNMIDDSLKSKLNRLELVMKGGQ